MQGRTVYPGARFGRLTVVSRNDAKRWLCSCDCGGATIVWACNLQSKRANTRSCGCIHAEVTSARHRRHGMSKTRTYRSWSMMLQRCTNPRMTQFPHYGGRGISVCEQWRSFDAFFADMGERPLGRELDRIDNEGNYEPGNCRWATRKEQMQNTRPVLAARARAALHVGAGS